MSNNFSLKGKTAWITGGSGDLGQAMATALLEAGARVAVSGRTAEDLEQAKKKGMETFPCDVTKSAEIAGTLAAVEKSLGPVDILIQAAGIQCRKPSLEMTEAEFKNVINVNLTGGFLCAQAVARGMFTRKQGKIIFITSLTAEFALPNMAAYVASRGGLKQLMKAFSVELAPHNIQVNAIGPGRFHTAMTDDVFKDTKTRESFLSLIPMGRAGKPQDLGGAAVFLASSASDYMTGQTLYVDGGWIAGGGNARS